MPKNAKSMILMSLRLGGGFAIGAYGTPWVAKKALSYFAMIPMVGVYAAHSYAGMISKGVAGYALFAVAKKIAPAEKLARNAILAGIAANIILVNILKKPMFGLAGIEPDSYQV